jgi:predicted nucleic acid-binding protein
MILVDSSALIEYYRLSGSPPVRDAVTEIIDAELAAVNGIVQVEVLAFASPWQTSYSKLVSDFRVLRWLNLREPEFDLACDLGQTLRKKGITIPSTDLIIAASAILSGATVYHIDSHFDDLARHCGLKARNLAAA